MNAGHFINEPGRVSLTTTDGSVVSYWWSDCTCGIRIYGGTKDELHGHEVQHLNERAFVARINRGPAHRMGAGA